MNLVEYIVLATGSLFVIIGARRAMAQSARDAHRPLLPQQDGAIKL